MAVILELGLKPTGFDNALKASSEKMSAFERQWAAMGLRATKSAQESMAAFQALFSMEDRLAAVQKKAQLERMANFQPEIILQREILGLRQSIAQIEGTTVEKLNLQIQLEEKILQLDRSIASARVQSAAALSGGGGAGRVAQIEKEATALDGVNTRLHRMFGLGEALKGVFSFFALANIDKIAEGIARAVTGVSESEEESLKKLEDVSTRAADSAIKALRSSLTEEQKYQLLLKERGALEESLAGRKIVTTADQVKLREDQMALDEKITAINEYQLKQEAQRSQFFAEQVKLRIDEAEAARKASYEDLTAAQKIRALKDDIHVLDKVIHSGALEGKNLEEQTVVLEGRKKELIAAQAEFKKQFSLSDSESHEMLLAQTRGLGTLNLQERLRYDTLLLQSKAKGVQAEIETILAKRTDEITQKDREHLAALLRKNDTLGQQITQKEKLLAAAALELRVERAVTDEQLKQLEAQKESNAQSALKSLMLNDQLIIAGKIYGASRDPNDITRASDAELMELIRRQKEEIDRVKSNEGRGPTALADAATNYLIHGTVIDRLQTDINRAQFELNQRAGIRSNVSTLGVDVARKSFDGDPLKFDELLDKVSRAQDRTDQTNNLLRDLVNRVGPGDIVDQLKKNGDDQLRGFNTLAQQILAASQRGKPLGG